MVEIPRIWLWLRVKVIKNYIHYFARTYIHTWPKFGHTVAMGLCINMIFVCKIRGIQKSYYSGDFIVNNSDVDDHQESLGYFSGVVSIYVATAITYCTSSIKKVACVEQPDGRLPKLPPRLCQTWDSCWGM